jgi:hypothetical protein
MARENQLNQATHCVVEYQVTDTIHPPVCMLITHCRLADAFNMAIPRRNSEWLRSVDGNHGVLVIIHAVGERIECMKEASRLSVLHQPRCNVYGYDKRGQRGVIACSNGQTYRTQMEAAEALGIDQGAISRVLRGAARSTSGLTFSYVTSVGAGVTQAPNVTEPYAGTVGLDGGMIDDDD